jgi:signal transduction histidine kinase/CheY-like chemotaxis protein
MTNSKFAISATPPNFQHKYDLVEEKRCQVLDNLSQAIALDNTNLNQSSQAATECSKSIQTAFKISEQRYYQLVSNVPAALYQYEMTIDGTHRLNYVSTGFSELFEIEPSMVLADITVLFNMVLPADQASFYQSLQEFAITMQPWHWEGQVEMPSGTIKWIRGASRPSLGQEGATIWDGVLVDVTDRKQIEIALLQSKQQYQKLSDNIPGVIYQFRLAPDGTITYPYISSGCWELLQLKPEEVMANSQCVIEIIHPGDLGHFQETMIESAQKMIPKLWEGRAILCSGEIKWIKSASRPELQADGSIIWDGIMFDITTQQTALIDRQQTQINLHLTNERLESTIQQLQKATQLKDEFLATMSHELRTPLNSILGMSEALQENIFGAINPQQLHAVSTIEQSGKHLLSLISDILDVSKISEGKLDLNVTKVSLMQLCETTLVFVRQQAIKKQICIESCLPPNINYILVDERRICQVLINLLDNAIKFSTHQSKVTLTVQLVPPNSDQSLHETYLSFAVADTGIGIADEDISKLFQPFVQLDSNLNRKYEGTGLGLVLVKQIAELHGGFVQVDSKLNQGCCFTVMIPQAQLSSLIANDPPSCSIVVKNSSNSQLILLAEDNDININTFYSYLTAKGYQIILARNGSEAIALTHNHQPDLILMDIQMPDMDGITAIQHLREQSSSQHIPIIALTAQTLTKDREKCLAVGANEYLTKPVKLRELHQTIQEYLDLK